MTSKYEVKLAGPFRAQLDLRLVWWANNREKNPHALDEDLMHFLEVVSDSPWAGPNLEGNAKAVRSMPLHKTHHRIAYRIFDDERVVYLVSIWNHREQPPKLRF